MRWPCFSLVGLSCVQGHLVVGLGDKWVFHFICRGSRIGCYKWLIGWVLPPCAITTMGSYVLLGLILLYVYYNGQDPIQFILWWTTNIIG